MPLLSQQYEIVNTKGLHARAATALVKTAAQFSSTITVRRDDVSANGKSVMSLLILAAPVGSTIVVDAEGDDAADAMAAIGTLITHGFGE